MFLYKQCVNELEETLLSDQKYKSLSQNDLRQFSGSEQLKLVKIICKTHIKHEFILQAKNMKIQNLELDNCLVDLSKACGNFVNITFQYGCELINDCTDQFHAHSVDFYTSVKLSQLKWCNVKQINVLANKQCQVDFEGAKFINTLNELYVQSIDIDLNALQGCWNVVHIGYYTSLRNALSDKFNARFLKINSCNQDDLKYLLNFRFNSLQIEIDQRKLFNQELLRQIQYKLIKLTLNHMNVDMQQLTGIFDEITLKQCTLLNNGTEQLSCKQLNVLNCNQQSVFSTQILYNINCKALLIQGCAMVNYLPHSLVKLNVANCQVILKNKNTNLQKITLNSVHYSQLPMSLLPILVEITSDNKYINVIYVQNAIKTRRKYQSMMQTNTKRIEILTTKRCDNQQHLKKLKKEFFNCLERCDVYGIE
ncbi:Hypothetical_protein [Hexamita inflata]|uniref:Hypothetical_protein n=1 Tax=Hexamita inflata TaxID=28002 RepID=A0AA86NGU7_9EUKA|nr:Hypothetical protein HINF_LOCUS6518 [Hexamita inflata]